MIDALSIEHRKAFDMMSAARKILYRTLHSPGNRTQDLVVGVDRLALAFEFVENPLQPVAFCPQCESFCLEITQNGRTCQCCNHHWS